MEWFLYDRYLESVTKVLKNTSKHHLTSIFFLLIGKVLWFYSNNFGTKCAKFHSVFGKIKLKGSTCRLMIWWRDAFYGNTFLTPAFVRLFYITTSLSGTRRMISQTLLKRCPYLELFWSVLPVRTLFTQWLVLEKRIEKASFF